MKPTEVDAGVASRGPRNPSATWLFALCLCTVAGFGVGCPDPCVQLAERICNCEASELERRACRTERITNQSSIESDDDDLEFCAKKLDTCDCAALDADDLDACGFVPDGDG